MERVDAQPGPACRLQVRAPEGFAEERQGRGAEGRQFTGCCHADSVRLGAERPNELPYLLLVRFGEGALAQEFREAWAVRGHAVRFH